MSESGVERAKLRVSIAAALVGALGLLVTYCSYENAVERGKVDRTLDLVGLADEPHFWKPREAFRTFLLRLPGAQRSVSAGLDEPGRRAAYRAIVARFLQNYRGGAMTMVGPLADYYVRLVSCMEAGACSADVYCTMVHRDLVVFADMTEAYRRHASGGAERVFAHVLDTEETRGRCG